MLRSFAVETISSIEYGDELAELLEDRVIRLEKIAAARWPRSLVLRRLGREIRASVADYDLRVFSRADFHGRRVQWASETVSGLSRARRGGAA